MRAASRATCSSPKTEIRISIQLEIDAGPLTDMREGLNVALR